MGEEGEMPRGERERSSIVRYERLSSEFSSKYTGEHYQEKTQEALCLMTALLIMERQG